MRHIRGGPCEGGGWVQSLAMTYALWPMGKSANVINGDDYLFRKCGFLAHQVPFYDSKLGQHVSSCRLSNIQASK